MRARVLAVSDAQRGKIYLYTLPDLREIASAEGPGTPGRMTAAKALFCADRSEATIARMDSGAFQPQAAFSAAPEIEALTASADSRRLYALSGGANCLQMLDAQSGQLLKSVAVGLHPRAMTLFPDGETLAVADGTTCRVTLFQAETLKALGSFSAGGITCGAVFFAGCLYALCAEGEYDLRTLVGYVDAGGKWRPQIALPGLPGAMTPCLNGLLVGHLGHLTMLEAPTCRIRWQTKVRGLPTQLVSLGQFACFADETDGWVGLIDARRGKMLRHIQLDCPCGLAAF